MAKRKLCKPTKGIPPKQDSIQPLINFGFLFRREMCQLSTGCSDRKSDEIGEKRVMGEELARNPDFLPIANLQQDKCLLSKSSGFPDSQGTTPCIQYTALLGCAELIQASLRDKHKMKTIFPYYNLLQTYKTARSSSYSSNGFAEQHAKTNGTLDGRAKNGDNPHGKMASIKSRRSSSVASVPSFNSWKEGESIRFSSQSLPLNESEFSSSPNGHGSNDCAGESLQNNSTSEQDEPIAASQGEPTGTKISGHNGGGRALKKKRCTSCTASKTPYWREGWEKAILLCNACGIRYQKYKKYCLKCLSIARKDDKGRLHCPDCNEKL